MTPERIREAIAFALSERVELSNSRQQIIGLGDDATAVWNVPDRRYCTTTCAAVRTLVNVPATVLRANAAMV